MTRAPATLAAAAAILLGCAAPAAADSKMSLSNGTLYLVNEDAGISNNLTVDNDPRNRVHFFDETDPRGMSFPTPPCSPGKVNNAGNTVEVFCDRGSFNSINIQIGPGEDHVNYTLNDLPVAILGEVGADTLTSAGANDSVHGGQGDDTLDSGAGDDSVTGDDGNDTIHAGDGNDKVDGGVGADTIDAGAGDDTVQAADGIADTIDCGPGTDTVNADGADQVANCETVNRHDVAAPADQPAGNDKTPPALQAGGSTSQRASLKRRRVYVAVTASEKALVDVSGYLDAGGINDRVKPVASKVDLAGGGVLVTRGKCVRDGGRG